MKRAGLQRISKTVIAFITITGLFLPVTSPVNAATVGSNQCIQNVDIATDVSVFQDSGSCYIAFKGIRTYVWTPPANLKDIDLLVVAGGGGGGARHAGGGGAGGLINASAIAISTSNLSITVGDGGAGGSATASAGSEGTNGSNSQVSGNGIATQTAIGGGGGGYTLTSGSGGSSGGGGCCGQAIGTASSGQGNIGGSGHVTAGTMYAGGGGGGAFASGSAASINGGGKGGNGALITWITTSAQSSLNVGQNVSSQIYFAGGGGGSTSNSGTAGPGGNGGGGAGANTASVGVDATANTGGGGGGSGMNGGGAYKGGNGGSGVVVIRYTIPVAHFAASSYTSGSTTWSNLITGGTAGTAPAGGMLKVISGPSGVIFKGVESSNSDRVISSIGSTASLDTITVEMWIRLKDAGNIQNSNGSMLFSWGSGNYNIYHYGDQVGFNTFQSQLYGISSSSYNNVWTHYVFQMTDTGPWENQKIYINGVLQNSTCRISPSNCTSSQPRVFDSSGSFQLMDNPYSANSWNAKADLGLVRIYNRDLSAAQVLENFTITQPDYVMPVNTVGSLSSSGGAMKGKTVSLTLSTFVDGKVQFMVAGKRIPGCISKETTGSYPSFSATCLWKPSISGSAMLTARLIPNDSTFSISTSTPLSLFISRRSDRR